MTKTLVFASSNLNKISEIKSILPREYALLSSKEVGLVEEIPETSNTLEGNALMKARFLYNFAGKSCFADDTGLEVEALGGAPGVYSARYAGEEKSAEKNIQKLLAELKEHDNRSAQFRTSIAYIDNTGEEFLFEGIVKGIIAESTKGHSGFGYDPVFLPEGLTLSFAEMSMNDKNARSHRARAFQQFIQFLETQKS